MLGNSFAYLKLHTRSSRPLPKLAKHLAGDRAERIVFKLLKENYLVYAVDKLGLEELAKLFLASDILLDTLVALRKAERSFSSVGVREQI